MIGTILDQLLADVIEDPALNTRMTLLTRASLILDRVVQREPGGMVRREPGGRGPTRPSIR